MIRQGKVARVLSRGGLLAVCSMAALALPVGAIFGQATPPSSAADPANPFGQQQRFAADQQQAEIAQARATVRQLRRELDVAMSRLALLERGAVDPLAGRPQPPHTTSSGSVGIYGGSGSIESTPANPAVAGIGSGGGGMQSGTAGLGGPMNRFGAGQGLAGAAPAGSGTTAAPGGGAYPPVIRPPGYGPAGMAPGGGGAGFGGGFGARRSDSDARIDRLEKQLRELMDQVKELKQQKSGDTGEGHGPISMNIP